MESHTPSGNNNLLNKSLIPDESMCHDCFLKIKRCKNIF